MEAAIRWSPYSTADNPEFVIIDNKRNRLQLCQARNVERNIVSYTQITARDKLPNITAFDWSKTHDSIVAIGTASGEATIINIDPKRPGSDQVRLYEVKHPRRCNSIAFSKNNKLAAGLDRVRNDSSLNVYDFNGNAAQSQASVWRTLASSEAISSVKFFDQEPELLLAGVARQCVRLYDLRDPVGIVSQITTRQAHNIAVDPLDENYFVSAGPSGEPVISLFDKRTLSRSGLSDSLHPGSVLEFRHAFDSSTSTTILGMRFSGYKRGSFAALTNVGHLKVFETTSFDRGQELSTKPSNPLGGSSWSTPSYIKHTYDLRGPWQDSPSFMAFDYPTNGSLVKGKCVIGLNWNREVEMIKVPSAPARIPFTASDELMFRRRRRRTLHPAVKRTIAEDLELSEQRALKRLKRIGRHSTTPKTKDRSGSQISVLKDATGSPEVPNLSTMNVGPRTSNESANTTSSAARHGKLQDLLWPATQPRLRDVLNRLSIYRRRCQEGYGLDCEKNKDIVANDPWLVEMWQLIARLDGFTKNYGMVTETLDLSWLGVWNIWHNALGPHPYRLLRENVDTARNFIRSVERICQSRQYPDFQGTKSESPQHRQLCLAICGWTFVKEDFQRQCEDLVKQGHHYKAMFLAVIQGHKDIAIRVLKHLIHRRGTGNIGLAAVIACDSVSEDQRELCSWMAEETKDIYLKALLTYFVTGQWRSVVDMEELSLVDRVSVALQHLNDDKLGECIKSLTSEAIRQGDVEGVILTGLSEQSMELFQNYITRSGDLQTAVLATAFSVPRFVSDPVWQIWKETYFCHMQTWRAFMERARFTTQHNKRSGGARCPGSTPATQRQVYLYCSKCKKPLVPDPRRPGKTNSFSSSPEKTDPSFPGTVLDGSRPPMNFNPLMAGSDSACPSCGEPMPRCAICLIRFKYPSRSSYKDTGSDEAGNGGGYSRGGGREQAEEMGSYINFCFNCGHAFHAAHAKEWFSDWAECPVPGCSCLCGLKGYGKE